MKYIYLLLFIPYVMLFGSEAYPQIFAQQGTPLFEAVYEFEKLMHVAEMGKAVEDYRTQSDQVLKLGKIADDTTEKKEKMAYLKALRSLQKSYDKTMRLAKKHLMEMMQKEDKAMFLTFAESGLDFGNGSVDRRMLAFYSEHSETIHSETMEKRIAEQRRTDASADIMSTVEQVSQEAECNLATLQHNLQNIIDKPAAFYALILTSGDDDWLRIDSRNYSITEDTMYTVGCKYYESTGVARTYLYPLQKPFSVDAHITRLEEGKFAALIFLKPGAADEYRQIIAVEDMDTYNKKFINIMQSNSKLIFAGHEIDPHVESTDAKLSGR